MTTVEVVGMVYRDPAFLVSMRDEIVRYLPEGVTWRIVGNDPNSAVIDAAGEHGIPLDIYKDPYPDDWYLSRVYRCWNYCVESSSADKVVLYSSDMLSSPRWLEPLLDNMELKIPVSRLVEPCRIKNFAVCPWGLQMDLGRHPGLFPRDAWEKVVAEVREPTLKVHGGYGPCLLDRELFVEVGGYPEGNVIIDDGKVVVLKPNPPRIDCKGPRECYVNGKPFYSGDDWLFREMKRKYGFEHVTCMDSVIYHMQEGEMCP